MIYIPSQGIGVRYAERLKLPVSEIPADVLLIYSYGFVLIGFTSVVPSGISKNNNATTIGIELSLFEFIIAFMIPYPILFTILVLFVYISYIYLQR